MVFPLYDSNPLELPRPPYVTWTLIAINIIVFLWTVSLPEADQVWVATFYGVMPAQLVQTTVSRGFGYADLTLITSMFLHGGWAHLLGNMIYLWVFGDDIEEALGSFRFLAFYLLVGVLSALAFVAFNPNSATPLVGASGAISGVIAGYLMLRPCAKVSVFVIRIVIRVRAYWVIGGWVALQLFSLIESQDDAVAYLAHIGGLISGAILFYLMRPAGVELFDCIEQPGAASSAT